MDIQLLSTLFLRATITNKVSEQSHRHPHDNWMNVWISA